MTDDPKAYFYFSDSDEDEEVIRPPTVDAPGGFGGIVNEKIDTVPVDTTLSDDDDQVAEPDQVKHHASPILGVAAPVSAEVNVVEKGATTNETVFVWYKDFNARLGARLQQGEDVEEMTQQAREELSEMIKASSAQLEQIHAAVLEQIGQVDTVIQTTTDMDKINQTLTTATENINAAFEIRHPETIYVSVSAPKVTKVIKVTKQQKKTEVASSSTVIRLDESHHEKAKSHTLTGAIAGAFGGIFSKKHHDDETESTLDDTEKKHHHLSSKLCFGGTTVKKHHDDKDKKDSTHGHKKDDHISGIVGDTLAVGDIVAGTTASADEHKKDDKPKIGKAPPKPFSIILVDIKKAAEERRIHCETKMVDGTTHYVALSYRWGELDEQMVRATRDYHARIVSFQLDDFFKLCKAMRQEPEMQHIPYVWVDAICVNQENMEKRKATIYSMNNIYIYASAIVAVPDLHASHISSTTAANKKVMAIIQRYRRYLYYLLLNTPESQKQLIDMDHAWMDSLGVPSLEEPRRELILAAHQRSFKKTKNDLGGFMQTMMTTLVATPTQKDRSMTGANLEEHYQQLSSRMMMEFQNFEWQQQLAQRQTDIIQSMDFLQSLMEDWSNRTWVISEYHIAKKRDGKLKFWYNQLSGPDVDGHAFFEFNFDKQHALNNHSEQMHPYTSHIIDLSRQFQNSMHQRLIKRSVVEMMLQSKASKHEDRFHSIIPLSQKYVHHIKDRNSIAALGISDMLSVRLKLMEWMDTKDRLNVLYSKRWPVLSELPSLPTFTSYFRCIRPDLLKILSRYVHYCNFDTKDRDSVRLVRGKTEAGGFDELWLCPRVYAPCAPPSSTQRSSFYYTMDGDKFWSDLGLDPATDVLDAISIPLFINIDAFLDKEDVDDNDDETVTTLLTLDIPLFGSWAKNIWFLAPLDDAKTERVYKTMDKQQLPDGFRIF